MEVIPAIDVLSGRCVRLYQGDYERATVFSEDPVAVARSWVEQGARRLHLVDLDGAREGGPVNRALLLRIVEAVRVPAQVGGGLRSLPDVAGYLEAGVERVVLATAAIRDQMLVAKACAQYPGRIAVALDAREGRVQTEGWTQSTEVEAVELVPELEEVGVARFIYTDVSRDGTLAGPNLAAIARLVEVATVPVIASGGVASLEHLRRLAATGVEGAIVGRALYAGVFTLREALEAV